MMNNGFGRTMHAEGLFQHITQIRLSRIILFVCFVLISVPLVTHYYLSKVDTNVFEDDILKTRARLEALEDFSSVRAADLKIRIEEMLRIKGSVSMELRDLEAKRSKLQQDIISLNQKIEEVKAEMVHQQMELDRVKISVQQAQVAHEEAVLRNTPELALPRKLLPASPNRRSAPWIMNYTEACTMEKCWDYSRCSITSGFPVFFYQEPDWEMDGFLATTMVQVLGYNPHIVRDPAVACAYLVLLGEIHTTPPANLSSYLSNLRYWGGDGRNHLVVQLTRMHVSESHDSLAGVITGRAIVLQSTFPRARYRVGFDVVIPPLLGPPGGDVWQYASNMVPSRRKFLASFEGEPPSQQTDANLINQLRKFGGQTSDIFHLHFECTFSGRDRNHTSLDWALCGTESMRSQILRESTFAIILAPPQNFVSTTVMQARLYEALKAGAIPVIIGGSQVQLSFSEVLAWRRAVFFIPSARVPELHFLLRSVSDGDILAMRRQGRMLWDAYLATVQAQVDTSLAVIRDRLGIPPAPARPEPSPDLFNSSFSPIKTVMMSPDAEPEESLGPLEPPYSSPKFQRNHTVALTQGFEVWNVWANPFWLYPQLPFDPVLPSDAKFSGSALGFRPIARGAGGAGKEFSESLGGNHPREQFTVVILTYEREQVLINSLSRLQGLPYLNKVVVVWNSPKPPLEDLRWPDIGVPIQLIRARRNTLNNRFLPYDTIETEAVLSVDDDAHLRHDEIMFGFRVWRERRDRIVGFPGRFHAWDLNHGGWLYNSNYSCELSMVLTGAAFFHKYYMYLYTHWLPQAIRDKVDEYVNCEDIALNFLVSHFTREPPIKVTSRWTFRCPGCPVSLSEDDTHFQERHKCIQFFSQVFGYTPLLNTQFRADSILFKTRIPHDKQKCFKFI